MDPFQNAGAPDDEFVPWPATNAKPGDVVVVSNPQSQAAPYEQRQALFGQDVFFVDLTGTGGGGSGGPGGEDPPGIRPGSEDPPGQRQERISGGPSYSGDSSQFDIASTFTHPVFTHPILIKQGTHLAPSTLTSTTPELTYSADLTTTVDWTDQFAPVDILAVGGGEQDQEDRGWGDWVDGTPSRTNDYNELTWDPEEEEYATDLENWPQWDGKWELVDSWIVPLEALTDDNYVGLILDKLSATYTNQLVVGAPGWTGAKAGGALPNVKIAKGTLFSYKASKIWEIEVEFHQLWRRKRRDGTYAYKETLRTGTAQVRMLIGIIFLDADLSKHPGRAWTNSDLETLGILDDVNNTGSQTYMMNQVRKIAAGDPEQDTYLSKHTEPEQRGMIAQSKTLAKLQKEASTDEGEELQLHKWIEAGSAKWRRGTGRT